MSINPITASEQKETAESLISSSISPSAASFASSSISSMSSSSSMSASSASSIAATAPRSNVSRETADQRLLKILNMRKEYGYAAADMEKKATIQDLASFREMIRNRWKPENLVSLRSLLPNGSIMHEEKLRLLDFLVMEGLISGYTEIGVSDYHLFPKGFVMEEKGKKGEFSGIIKRGENGKFIYSTNGSTKIIVTKKHLIDIYGKLSRMSWPTLPAHCTQEMKLHIPHIIQEIKRRVFSLLYHNNPSREYEGIKGRYILRDISAPSVAMMRSVFDLFLQLPCKHSETMKIVGYNKKTHNQFDLIIKGPEEIIWSV